MAAEMDFAFLFDANRQLFPIGYRVEEARISIDDWRWGSSSPP